MRHFPSSGIAAACLLLLGAAAAPAAIFEPLFTAKRVIGPATITLPSGVTKPMRKDHAYPYGSRIVVPAPAPSEDGEPQPDPEVVLSLARDFRFRIPAGTDLQLLDASTGAGDSFSEVKVFDIAVGTVATVITASATKTGGAGDAQVDANLAAIVIRTPVAECTRLSERNEVQVAPDPYHPGAWNCLFASQSGMMEIYGPQFEIKGLKQNTAIEVGGDRDHTTITTRNGEYTVFFEKGADAKEKVYFKARFLGKIWREYAEIGGRMGVAVMVYYPDGNLHSYRYLEGETNVGMWTSAAAAVLGENAVYEGGGAGEEGGEEGWGSSDSSSDWGSSDSSSSSDWGSSDSSSEGWGSSDSSSSSSSSGESDADAFDFGGDDW